MSEKHDQFDSHIFQVKQKDLNEKDHNFNDGQIYPESTQDMTCWQKFKNCFNNFVNRTIDYFQYDRVFNGQGQPTIQLKRCYKRFLQNYDETYSERSMRFAFSFDYVLQEKLKEENKKQKNFCTQFYRFICCQGGNEMEQIDESYKSEREYQRLIKKKLLEKKQEYEEIIRKEEEEKEKQMQQEKNKLENKEKLQEIINNDSLEFYDEGNYKRQVQKNKKTSQPLALNTKILKVNQTEQHILSEVIEDGQSGRTHKKGVKTNNTKQKNIFYNQYEDNQDQIVNTRNNKYAKSFNSASDPQIPKNTSNKQLTNSSTEHNITKNIYHENHIFTNVTHDETEGKRKKKNRVEKDFDDFEENDDARKRQDDGTTNLKKNTRKNQYINEEQISQNPKRKNDHQSNLPQNSNNYSNVTDGNNRSPNIKGKNVQNQRELVQNVYINGENNKNSHQNPQYVNQNMDKSTKNYQNRQRRQGDDDQIQYEHIYNTNKINTTNDQPGNRQGKTNKMYQNQRLEGNLAGSELTGTNKSKNQNNFQQDPQNSNKKRSNNQNQDSNYGFDYQFDENMQSPGKNDQSSKAKRKGQQKGQSDMNDQIDEQYNSPTKQGLPKSPKINNDDAQLFFDQEDDMPNNGQQAAKQSKKRRKQNNKANMEQDANAYSFNEDDQQNQNGRNPPKQNNSAQDMQNMDNMRSKKQKKVKNAKKSNEQQDFEISMNDNDNQMQQMENAPAEQARKKKKVKRMLQNNDNLEEEITLDDFAMVKNYSQDSNEQNISNTVPVQGGESVLQASKKRRNKKQLRAKEDELNIEEVIFDAPFEESQALPQEGSFVKAEKKKRRVKQRIEEENNDEEVIQINF